MLQVCQICADKTRGVYGREVLYIRISYCWAIFSPFSKSDCTGTRPCRSSLKEEVATSPGDCSAALLMPRPERRSLSRVNYDNWAPTATATATAALSKSTLTTAADVAGGAVRRACDVVTVKVSAAATTKEGRKMRKAVKKEEGQVPEEQLGPEGDFFYVPVCLQIK